jgi:alpha-methylacyl-CoA racemase
VIRIEQLSSVLPDILCRGKRSLAINIKIPSGREILKKLIAQADILIDPFRPSVLEGLGLGPEIFLGSESNKRVDGLNKRLIYARLAG